MKKSIYDKLEDIPQIDRDENNYQLCTDAGSPNNGKYVLILDGAHPVQAKNTELLVEKSQRDAAQTAAINAAVAPKETEIINLKAALTTAQTQTGLPAGQIAVPAEKVQVLNQFESLGKFEEVKAKVEEHGTLKEQTEAAMRKTLYSDAAKAHDLEPDAFTALAEQQKLHERLEMREVPDPKKPTEKVKHYFVKGKDAAGADTSTVLGDFVKADDFFKPFVASLTAKPDGGNGRRIPDQGVGNPPKETSGGKVYINKAYKRPDQQNTA